MAHNIIGISGVAGSGKDLLFELIKSKIPAINKISLADPLKSEVRQSIIDLYNIDILNCTRPEKDLIRPFLVAHGKIRRNQSGGRHWINLATEKIKNALLYDSNAVFCVTDIRYDQFEKDEVSWLKDEMKGFLIHLSLYEEKDGQKVFVKAPNQDEAENEPKLISKANLNIEWPKILKSQDQNSDFKELDIYVEKCINAFSGK